MSFFRKTLFQFFIILFFIFLLFYASDCIQAGKASLILCLERVIPSLFPFFVLSRLIISSGLTHPLGKLCRPLMQRIFRLRGELAVPFLLGITGGYPIGAATISSMYRTGQCSREEGQRLLAFSSNTGPAFAVGMCGATLFGSVKIGCFIYIIHVLSACLTGFLFSLSHPLPSKTLFLSIPEPEVSSSEEIVTAIKESFTACLSITAFVTFFSILVCLLDNTGILSVLTSIPCFFLPGLQRENGGALVWGIFEIAGGLSTVQPEGIWALPLCSFLLAFGSLSVFFQTQNVLAGTDLSILSYIKGKLVQSFLAFSLTLAFFFFFL